MTTVLLIRHGMHMLGGGVIAGRTPDVHLSPDGQSEAEQLVERLHGVDIAAIYCSPMERTRETAAPLAKARQLSVDIRDDLTELDYGDWTGAALDDLRRDDRWTSWNAFRSGHRVPGGESMVDVQARIVGAIRALVDEHDDDECIALFSHGDLIKAAVAHFLGSPLDLFQRIEVSTASISAVLVAELGAHILFVNNVGSPAALLPAP